MLTILVRSVILYAGAVLALRLMGKRQVGQLQPYELAVVIMIAELAATPMGSVGIPLLYGVIPICALLACHGLLTWISAKSQRWDAVISGEPTVLIRDGVICGEALRKMGLSVTELMEAVRLGGQMDVSRVGTAVMEPSGRISVFPKSSQRALTPEDMQIDPGREDLPLPLVIDGRLHAGNTRLAGLDEQAVRRLLAELGVGDIREQLLFLRTCDGSFHAQRRDGRIAVKEASK